LKPAHLKPVHREVILLCPGFAKSGGAEAIHQLAHMINKQGGNARIAYHGKTCRTEISDGILRCDSASSELPEFFARYEPRVLKEVALGPDILLVYSEILWDEALKRTNLNGARSAIWWLSVDNACTEDLRILDDTYRRKLLADPLLTHFYQSEYAYAFLKRADTPVYYPLSDYTDPAFVARAATSISIPRANDVCYFPLKAGAQGESFFAHSNKLRNTITKVAIRDMTKTQVADALFKACIYIDFGPHPGKDRIPREAAVAGAIILLRAAGAAKFYGDHPLPPSHIFTDEQFASGHLYRLVDEILDNPEPHLAAQSHYRHAVTMEHEIFSQQVRSFFFQ
jgi:hypothetical protein